MKTVWIGTIALAFVLGTGMVAMIYILGKLVISYSRDKSKDTCHKLTYLGLIEA